MKQQTQQKNGDNEEKNQRIGNQNNRKHPKCTRERKQTKRKINSGTCGTTVKYVTFI